MFIKKTPGPWEWIDSEGKKSTNNPWGKKHPVLSRSQRPLPTRPDAVIRKPYREGGPGGIGAKPLNKTEPRTVSSHVDPYFKLAFNLNFKNVYVYLYAHMPGIQKRVLDTLGARVTGCCELPNRELGTELGPSARVAFGIKHRAIHQPQPSNFYIFASHRSEHV